jgi:hypothetical protein
MCVAGYSMNSQQQCVKSDDEECKAEAGQDLNLVYLPPAPTCWEDLIEK